MKEAGARLPTTFLVPGLACLAVAAITALIGRYEIAGPALVLMLALLALSFFRGPDSLRTFAFTFWVLALFFAGVVFPRVFGPIGGFKQSSLIVPLIQVIMFGMGATLSLQDFARALKMPKAVFLGMALQFSVMPLAGWAIATSFGFEPEIAAGIILIGSCSGGVASNVMAYLSKGNVALSVTMTAISTVMAPFVTPFAMKLLAGRLIEIDVAAMMLSIVNLILLPVAIGLVTHHLLHARAPQHIWRPAAVVLAIICFFAARAGSAAATQLYTLAGALLLMSMLRQSWLERGLPIVSMAGICYIIAIIAANSREDILHSGALLFAAALLHNLTGYVLGFWGARACRLAESDCRTVALEVGMQNGGMGTALALNVLHSNAAALGPAIFGTWMNITGSVLSCFWRGRPPKNGD